MNVITPAPVISDSPRHDRSTRLAVSPATGVALGLFLMIGGIVFGIVSPRDRMRVWPGWGIDFATVYVTGDCMLHGYNAYDPAVQQAAFTRAVGNNPTWGIPYPPSTGIIVLPFAALPFHVATIAFYCVCIAAMLYGTWSLLVTFAPQLTPSNRILILGILMCSCSTRWGLMLLQSAPLLLGLLGLFMTTVARERSAGLFILMLLAMCLKMTFGLPFVGIALLQRRFGAVAAAVVVVVLLNVGGFARMGGMQAYQDYKTNVAGLEVPNSINSPNPWETQTTGRTDWAVLVNAISPNIERSRKIVMVLSVISALWLAWLGLKARPVMKEQATLTVFLAPLVCISLLCVYHHLYDSILLLAPLLLYCFGPGKLRSYKAAWWFIVPTVLYAVTYFASVVKIVTEHTSPVAYALGYKTFGPLCVTIAFVASLVVLNQYLHTALKRST